MDNKEIIEQEEIKEQSEIIEADENSDNTEESYEIEIAPDVVATIAGVSAREIKGVVGMCGTFAGGIAEILGGKKSSSRGIKINIDEQKVVIDMSIVVEFGVKIPELAWELQETVKNNVETMTGLTVEKINVHVDDIKFPNQDKVKNTDEENDDPDIIEEFEIEEAPSEEDEYLL